MNYKFFILIVLCAQHLVVQSMPLVIGDPQKKFMVNGAGDFWYDRIEEIVPVGIRVADAADQEAVIRYSILVPLGCKEDIQYFLGGNAQQADTVIQQERRATVKEILDCHGYSFDRDSATEMVIVAVERGLNLKESEDSEDEDTPSLADILKRDGDGIGSALAQEIEDGIERTVVKFEVQRKGMEFKVVGLFKDLD